MRSHAIIGQRVRVTVDRPLGSRHPQYPELRYPVHYGYVDGIPAADGEAQDAYVLGVSQPVSAMDGVVIAVIHRLNDEEDKWVVVPDAQAGCWSREAIAAQVHFQEQYFDTEILM